MLRVYGEKPWDGTFVAEGRRLDWVEEKLWDGTSAWTLRDRWQPSIFEALLKSIWNEKAS